MTCLSPEDAEIVRCRVNPSWFVWHHCRVKDEQSGRYVPFHMWPAQQEVLEGLHENRLAVLLKARQLGITTVVICYAVWLAIFRPHSTILLFSKTQKESHDLIKRIRVLIRQLPPWLQPKGFVTDASSEIELTNGSKFIAFASRSSGGDSFTASLVIVDEADLIPDLNELLSGAKPTIDAGGKLVMLSRADKSQPDSPFKATYRSAIAGENGFWCKFLPWASSGAMCSRS